MDTPLTISYTLTREDWVTISRLCFDSSLPAYTAAARQARRARLHSMLVYGPCIIAIAAVFIGSRDATSGMYLEGAIGGAILVGLFLMYLCDTRKDLAQARRAAEHEAHHAEYGDFVGPQSLHAGPDAVTSTTPLREFKQSWAAFESLLEVGPYLMLHGPLNNTLIIPRRAFPTPEAADAAAASLRRWLNAGRAAPAARVAAYLADRDLPCPSCTYNLRGITADRCPECGAPLSIDLLQSHAASRPPSTPP